MRGANLVEVERTTAAGIVGGELTTRRNNRERVGGTGEASEMAGRDVTKGT